MALVLVKGMPLEPRSCVCCGGGPQTTEGEIRECVFAEGVDIDFGGSVYICPVCVRVMAELYEFKTSEEVEKLNERLEELKDIEKKYKKLNKRVKAMVEGTRARKEVSQDETD